MSKIEVTNEPTPRPRKSGKPPTVACRIRFMENGKEVNCIKTGPFFENERQTRKSRKY